MAIAESNQELPDVCRYSLSRHLLRCGLIQEEGDGLIQGFCL